MKIKTLVLVTILSGFFGFCQSEDETNKRNTQDLLNTVLNATNIPVPNAGCRPIYDNAIVSGKLNGGGINGGGYIVNNVSGQSSWTSPNDTTLVFTENLSTNEYQNWSDHGTWGATVNFTKVSTYTYASKEDLIREGELYPNSPTPKYVTYNVIITGGPQDGTNYTYNGYGSTPTGNYAGVDVSTATFSDSRSAGYLYYTTSSVVLNGTSKESIGIGISSSTVASNLCP